MCGVWEPDVSTYMSLHVHRGQRGLDVLSITHWLVVLKQSLTGIPDPLISAPTVLGLQVMGLHTGFCLDSEDLNSGLAQCVLFPLSYVPFPICHPPFASVFPSHLLRVDFT